MLYITKYALTKGILTSSNFYIDEDPLYPIRYAIIKDRDKQLTDKVVEIGKEAFLSQTEAIEKVKEMREKKIKTLRQQLAKIEAIDPNNLLTNVLYITKYALTKGILTSSNFYLDREDTDNKKQYAVIKDKFHEQLIGDHAFEIGKDAFLTKKEAVEKVKKIKEKKINTLKRQLAKLEALNVNNLF